MDLGPVDPVLAELSACLVRLQAALSDAETQWSSWLAAVDPAQRANAVNMVHYWALRQEDLRALLGGAVPVGVWMGVRRLSASINAAGWEREWAQVGPEWTGWR